MTALATVRRTRESDLVTLWRNAVAIVAVFVEVAAETRTMVRDAHRKYPFLEG